ncbi:hypothetical protein AJ85_18415 [Alkalihalobacillus alcalophilus ATCC 27647 = CGMCC 1.3604]|uniref:DUF2399 domain-containing protein n=1 Tax=Alkalihalobacillus alcalophilus ATCC 27647 = CGMCC 1.3604 TaxID=1218173 RepID=A0A4S4K336_ALKAL|nr:DUF2399 domain-containing protein [Alkalihalobacillus alcalophilus]MED1560719.1 DUF2399 domain-containing protein [Alkalihalobacillus alcalophilus]THG92055.1 hypothetical protein AJ85_18415 [Alkalihalobacillus alcalophilus ATCC 27647 = CGMCC 1.3604]
MIDQSVKNFIEIYVLKKGEELRMNRLAEESSPFIEVEIIKKTARTYRKVGELMLAPNVYPAADKRPDPKLEKLNLTLKKRVQLNEYDRTTLQWLEQGWIIKEVRFEKDEKTIQSSGYRMGYQLFAYLKHISNQNRVASIDEFNLWKERLNEILQMVPVNQDLKRQQALTLLEKTLVSLIHKDIEVLSIAPQFPPKWSLKKRIKFLDFALATFQLSKQKDNFDWKEVGASYYKEIGGSKVFDSNKEEFIAQLEEWAECPIVNLGLTSLGKITPLYFSGDIKGRYSSYSYGPVHSLTDLAIAEENYQTKATTLWLVENRAILTRVASEKGFLKEMNTLMVCVDGHLRTSHRRCIQQLLANGDLKQVLIWCDYDKDGLQISKELFQACSNDFDRKYKWITDKHNVITEIEEFEKYMEALLGERSIEQEQVLGGKEDWIRWITH